MARAESSVSAPHKLGFLATLRNDGWWVEPALVGAGLSIFLGYLTVSAFLDKWAFEVGPYLTPVFEPKLAGVSDFFWFSPALIVFFLIVTRFVVAPITVFLRPCNFSIPSSKFFCADLTPRFVMTIESLFNSGSFMSAIHRRTFL